MIISHDRKLQNTDQLIINLSSISHQLFGVSDYEDDRLSFPKCQPFLVWCILKPTNENKTKKNMRKACKNAASVSLCHCKSDIMQCSVLHSMLWDECNEMNRLGPVVRSPIKLKPGFHIVVSVVRKKIIGQLQLYGNLPYKCSIQLKKRQIQLVVRDRMNSICPMNFFRTTHTTNTTIWKPGLILGLRKF